ncbi:hypothetical protein D3C72_1634370 [compost metagenome]
MALLRGIADGVAPDIDEAVLEDFLRPVASPQYTYGKRKQMRGSLTIEFRQRGLLPASALLYQSLQTKRVGHGGYPGHWQSGRASVNGGRAADVLQRMIQASPGRRRDGTPRPQALAWLIDALKTLVTAVNDFVAC